MQRFFFEHIFFRYMNKAKNNGKSGYNLFQAYLYFVPKKCELVIIGLKSCRSVKRDTTMFLDSGEHQVIKRRAMKGLSYPPAINISCKISIFSKRDLGIFFVWDTIPKIIPTSSTSCLKHSVFFSKPFLGVWLNFFLGHVGWGRAYR